MTNFNFQHVQYTTIRAETEGSHLVILAGVHGDEYEPMVAAKKMISAASEVLARGSVSIVPIVNRSAFERASRCGEDGLDLARTCPGRKGGTISERVAAEVSELISAADYLIDLHGGGNLYELDPLCGYMLHSSPEVLEKQRKMARAFNLKTMWGTSSKLDGRTLSVARDHNVPAIYTEFGGGGGFKKAIVDEYVQGCLNILRALNMSESVFSTGRCEYELEDHRDNSGHLQIMLPAPSAGFFEAEVNLGNFVQAGSRLGTISDAFGRDVIPVHADQDGMVFLLRAVPSVKKGDTLGGILPIKARGKGTVL